MQSVFSPDQETFLTPPSTPTITESDIRPSLSRRSSRPSSLRIEHSADHWKPDIILDNQPSPDSAKNNTPSTATASSYANGVGHINRINGINGINGNSNIVPNGLPPSLALTPTVTHQQLPQAPVSPAHHHSPRPQQMAPALTSPCFVHSQLQGASFSDWLKAKHAKPEFRDARLAEPSHKRIGVDHGDGTHPDRKSYYVQDDDEGVGSLTKQLAETAVGVREMSKQLGRTRVHSAIQSVLIVTKARDNRLINLTRQLALYLMLKPQKGGRGLIVYVDTQLKQSRRFDAASIEKDHPHLFIPYPRRRPSSNSLASTSDEKQDPKPAQEGQLRYWTADMCSRSPDLFDFVVTLGGDGTVLFTSWLFQRIVPPVIPFALGSLGFLTNFDFDDHQSVMDTIIESGIRVNLRMRFTCTVYRAVSPREDKRRRAVKKGDTGEILMKNLEKGGWEALENGYSTQTFMGPDGKCPKDKEIMCFTTRPVESFEVLNDLVVDRGPSPYVSLLELFGDEHHLTTVQADGLTISTPTGSTAYSLSAGGSLVHPEIPAILITPICPHTLSFRPMLLPDSIELRICVPFNSRSTAWASFDGRGRVELKQGDHIKVTASKYPFPTVCADSQSTDWFHSISRTLKWNERERQKSFVVVEEGPSTKKDRKRRTSSATESSISSTGPANAHVTSDTIDDEEDEVSSEEEEKFDIDDLSSNESPKTASSAASAPDIARVYGPNEEEETLGREKMLEDQGFPVKREAQAEAAARSLLPISPLLERPKPKPRSKSRSRSRSGRSGLETPDRFAGPHPHPPKVSPRHVQFMQNTPSSSSSSIADVTPVIERDTTVRGGERGSRDDIHSPSAHGGGKSRIPISRDLDAESQKTPTMSEGERRWKSKEREYPGMSVEPGSSYPRRAFAVWGQDESDSAASDSDA